MDNKDYKRLEEEYNKRYHSKKTDRGKGLARSVVIIIIMLVLYFAACVYGAIIKNLFIIIIAVALFILALTALYMWDSYVNKDRFDSAHRIRMEALDEAVMYFLPGEKTYSKRRSFISVVERKYFSSTKGKALTIISGAERIFISFVAFVLSVVSGLMPEKNINWLVILIISFVLERLLNTDYFSGRMDWHQWFYKNTIVRYKEYLEEQEILENERIMKDTNESICDRVFSKAKEKGISDDELAQRTGISRFDIDEWRNNNKMPRAEEIMTICDILEVTPEWLLAGENRNSMVDSNKGVRKE